MHARTHGARKHARVCEPVPRPRGPPPAPPAPPLTGAWSYTTNARAPHASSPAAPGAAPSVLTLAAQPSTFEGGGAQQGQGAAGLVRAAAGGVLLRAAARNSRHWRCGTRRACARAATPPRPAPPCPAPACAAHLERPDAQRLLQPQPHAHGPLAQPPALAQPRHHQPRARVVVGRQHAVLRAGGAARRARACAPARVRAVSPAAGACPCAVRGAGWA